VKEMARNLNLRFSIFNSRFSLLLLILCCFPALTGCGHKGPEVVRVEGTTTLGGGPWPKPGSLFFTVSKPAPGIPSRPAGADFDTDGRITVTTFKKGDGLIPGTYNIAVKCWEIPPTPTSPGKSYVPQRYQSPMASGLTAVVEPGQRMLKLSLDVPKH